jgi:DNA-binding transcriptional ArsR family regulator
MWQHVAGGDGEHEYIGLDELEGAEVSVAAAPLESALVTTIATLRARRPVAALRQRDVEALRPLVDYRTRAWPSCLTRAAGERDFAADVAAGVRQGRLHAAVWAPVLDAPERWLRAYSAAIERVWGEVAPRWRRAAGLLQREAERVEAAAGQGGLALATSAGSVRGGTWRLFERSDPAGLRLRRGRLVLRPLLAPVSLIEAGDELLSVSYPLAARRDDSPPASLDALLAPARATILRALDRPLHAGQLADRHGFSPSGMTHHLGTLEKAGLIARERAGRRVLVQRTHRGTQLLALYE